MIDEAQFRREIEEFQRLSVLHLPDECWRVKSRRNAGHSKFLECEGKFIDEAGISARIVASVCHNNVYQVPVLWFNFYDLDGKLLLFTDFERLIRSHAEQLNVPWGVDLMEGISQNEHPVHGIAYYNLHPCRTAELLRPLAPRNVVMSFLSIFGPLIGLTTFPPEMLMDPTMNSAPVKAI